MKSVSVIKQYLIYIALITLISFYVYAGILYFFYPSFIFKEDPQGGDFIYWYIVNVFLFVILFPIEIIIYIILDIIQFETHLAFIYHLLCLFYFSLFFFDPGGIILWVFD
jgi:hypothetical protein